MPGNLKNLHSYSQESVLLLLQYYLRQLGAVVSLLKNWPGRAGSLGAQVSAWQRDGTPTRESWSVGVWSVGVWR